MTKDEGKRHPILDRYFVNHQIPDERDLIVEIMGCPTRL